MLTDDEIIRTAIREWSKSSQFLLLAREYQGSSKTQVAYLETGDEKRKQAAIRLARWAYEKGKESADTIDKDVEKLATQCLRQMKENNGCAPSFMVSLIEQARASCLNECAGCHEKKFATIPFCQRCIVKKEASIRADAHLEGQRHGEVMAHPKNCKANYDWVVRDAEASIRADERRKMEDKHMSQKRDWYDDGYAKGKEEGISAVEKELAKEGLERKQLNLVDGYIQVDDLIERIEEALAAARKKKKEG